MLSLPKGPWIEQQTQRLWNFRADFCLCWQLNTFHHPMRPELSSDRNWDENDLVPLETNTGHADSDSKQLQIQFLVLWMAAAWLVFLSVPTQTWTITFCVLPGRLISILSSDIFSIYKLISTLQRPVTVYYLCKTGIPWKLNCFLNRPHDKQQLAPKFQLRKELLPNTDINSFKISHASTYSTLSALFVTYIASIWAWVIVIVNELTPAIAWHLAGEMLRIAALLNHYSLIQIVW